MGKTYTRPSVELRRDQSEEFVRAATFIVGLEDTCDYPSDGTAIEVEMQSAVNALPGVGGKVVLLDGDYVKSNAAGIEVPSNVEIELVEGATIRLADGLDVDAYIFTNSDKVNGNENIRIHGGILDPNCWNQAAGNQAVLDFENVSAGLLDSWIQNYSVMEAKAKNSDVKVINRRFLRPIITISDCEDLVGFTHTEGAAVDTPGVEGANCIKLTTPLGGFSRIAINTRDFSREEVEVYSECFWIKFEDITKIEYIYWTQGAYYTQANIVKLFEDGKWYKVRSAIENAFEDYWQLRVQAQAGEVAIIYVDKVTLEPNPMHPVVALVLDDGLDNALVGARIAEKTGAKIGYAIRPEMVDGGGYLTLAELDRLYNYYEHDLLDHYTAFNDTPLNVVTIELVYGRRWFDEHGYTRGAAYKVYGGHYTTGEIENVRRQTHSGRRVPILAQINYLDFYDHRLCSVPNLGAEVDFPDFADQDKRYIRSHLGLIYVMHAVTGAQITALDEFCDLCYDWGIKVTSPVGMVTRVKPLVEPYYAYVDHFTDVLAQTLNTIVNAENINLADIPPGATHICTIAAQPDVPRNVRITVTDGNVSITDFTIVINGIDAKGNPATNSLHFAGGLTQQTARCFATISSVEITVLAGADAGDTLDVGLEEDLGLSNHIENTGDVFKVKKNNADWPSANYTVFTSDDSVRLSAAGGIGAGDDFSIYYKSNINRF